MGKSLGANAVRIAVKDEETNNKMIQIMGNAMKMLILQGEQQYMALTAVTDEEAC